MDVVHPRREMDQSPWGRQPGSCSAVVGALKQSGRTGFGSFEMSPTMFMLQDISSVLTPTCKHFCQLEK